MTLATVARFLHVTPALVRAWEAGWLVPSPLRCYELAVAYEVREDLIEQAIVATRRQGVARPENIAR